MNETKVGAHTQGEWYLDDTNLKEINLKDG